MGLSSLLRVKKGYHVMMNAAFLDNQAMIRVLVFVDS